jgi:diguanylate cyclase (GGDEF)-like protein
LEELKVKDLMSPCQACLPPTASLVSVAGVMVKKQLSCIVIGEQNHPQGIITERDLVKVLIASQQQPGLLEKPVTEFMSAPVTTIRQSETLYEALVVARSEAVRHLPVVDDEDVIVGLATQVELANAHFHVVEMQSEIIEKSIAAQTRDLAEANETLQALSMEDHLLEIGNRRSMEVDLEHTHAAALRYGRMYSVVLLDVDYFKLYNDHYGHNMGDKALQSVATYLKGSIRDADRVYRYGGEELLILLPEIGGEHALLTANRLVRGLANLALPHCESPLGILTSSAGASDALCGDEIPPSWEHVAAAADRGLYRAKSAGRNRAAMESQPAQMELVG